MGYAFISSVSLTCDPAPFICERALKKGPEGLVDPAFWMSLFICTDFAMGSWNILVDLGSFGTS